MAAAAAATRRQAEAHPLGAGLGDARAFLNLLPTVGLVLRGSFASTLFGVVILPGGALVGSTISGVFADGGRTGSIGFFASTGTTC